MTAPRQVLKNATYLVTRRCARRQLRLRPSALTNGIFLFVLAVAASRYGIRVHAFCVMSNHFHIVLTDPEAQLPAFEQHLASLVARALNAISGQWEAFWAPGSYSAVRLTSPDDVVDKIAYVLANPVSAGLVRRGRDWPGLWSGPEKIGANAIVAPRPDAFFREDGNMPELASIEPSIPPGFDDAPEFRRRLAAAVQEREDRAAAKLASEGRSFLGARRILAQRDTSSPGSIEPRRNLNPRIAARDTWKRIEAISRLREFLSAYREALRKWRTGIRDVLFPPGTYLLRVTHAVACATS
jgi:REP element-mobilizing transposase RayT